MLQVYSRVLPNRGDEDIDYCCTRLLSDMLRAYSRVLQNRGGVDVDFNGALNCYLICYRHIVDYCQTEEVWMLTLMVL